MTGEAIVVVFAGFFLLLWGLHRSFVFIQALEKRVKEIDGHLERIDDREGVLCGEWEITRGDLLSLGNNLRDTKKEGTVWMKRVDAALTCPGPSDIQMAEYRGRVVRVELDQLKMSERLKVLQVTQEKAANVSARVSAIEMRPPPLGIELRHVKNHQALAKQVDSLIEDISDVQKILEFERKYTRPAQDQEQDAVREAVSEDRERITNTIKSLVAVKRIHLARIKALESSLDAQGRDVQNLRAYVKGKSNNGKAKAQDDVRTAKGGA